MSRTPAPEDHPWVRAILDANISNLTKEQYVRNVYTLQRLANGRLLEDIIAHPKTMLKRIEAEYDANQTRKSLVSTIKALYKYNPKLKDKYPAQFEKWSQRFREIDRAIINRVAHAEPTQKELLNWVEWKDVLQKQHELASTQYGSIPHLLLSMYSLIEPIRADYGNVRIIEGSRAIPPQNGNYIFLSPYPNQSKLVLHSYKTSRKYGAFERVLPDNLVDIIRASLRQDPRSYLFASDEDSPYLKKNSYTRFANRTFERIFGKRFTISLMRHSFISNIDFNESTPATLFQYSKNMMHSIGMQQLYRRKIPSLQVQREGHIEESVQSPVPDTMGRVLYI